MLIKFVKYSIKEYLFAYFSLLFLIGYWSSAYRLPADALRYSYIISGVVAILIIANIVESVIKFRKELAAERQEEDTTTEQNKERWRCDLGLSKKKVGTFVLTLLYPVLLPIVGFLPLSVIYLFGLSYFLGIRNTKAMIFYSVIVTAFLFLIFEVWLGISLPHGFLGSLI